MKNYIITISICLPILFSCKKENTKIYPQTELSSAQKNELSILDNQLKEETSFPEKSGIGVTPSTDDNYMDAYGLNFQNAFLKANELNSTLNEGVSIETARENWNK